VYLIRVVAMERFDTYLSAILYPDSSSERPNKDVEVQSVDILNRQPHMMPEDIGHAVLVGIAARIEAQSLKVGYPY